MKWWRFSRSVTLQFILGVMLTGLLPAAASAQEEVTSAIRRYKEREASTGYYEEYEVKPRRNLPLVRRPERAKPFPYSPSAAKVRLRTNLADSHRAVQFYEVKRCEECHVDQAQHSHTVRGNLTCRQCHGGEPIAAINHYFSPMNPIRRHAYVCAKCHEGANVSFATFLVHEPPAGAAATRKTFPSLFYVNWFMYILIVGTLGFFLAHTGIWVTKELYLSLRERKKPEEEVPEKPEEEIPERPEEIPEKSEEVPKKLEKEISGKPEDE